MASSPQYRPHLASVSEAPSDGRSENNLEMLPLNTCHPARAYQSRSPPSLSGPPHQRQQGPVSGPPHQGSPSSASRGPQGPHKSQGDHMWQSLTTAVTSLYGDVPDHDHPVPPLESVPPEPPADYHMHRGSRRSFSSSFCSSEPEADYDDLSDHDNVVHMGDEDVLRQRRLVVSLTESISPDDIFSNVQPSQELRRRLRREGVDVDFLMSDTSEQIPQSPMGQVNPAFMMAEGQEGESTTQWRGVRQRLAWCKTAGILNKMPSETTADKLNRVVMAQNHRLSAADRLVCWLVKSYWVLHIYWEKSS